jgi:hypothetical protein
MAALRFIHVVGRDKDGEAFGGERMNLIPELAPCLGVDACGGLVEQQKLWAWQSA